ncbi:MAG: AAA family ATPase, partial [Candidatus Dormibacteraceae bacterium]
MRIERLDLTRFGCFSDRSLDFSAPGIHIVTGPNEAGKSTARHAVAELLYGIEVRSAYDFVHTKSQLQIGARLRGHDDTVLEFIRYKKIKDSLKTPDGKVLEQDELTALLAGVRREEFTTIFAINHQELQHGGKRLLEGKGDLSRALFESRSSLPLTELLDQLDRQLDELFKPRAQHLKLNARIRKFSQAKSTTREAELRPEKYQDTEGALIKARKQREQLLEQWNRASIECDRLKRIKQTRPALQQRRELSRQLHELIDAGPQVRMDTGKTLDRLLNDIRVASESAKRANRQRAQIREQLTGLDPDETLLDHTEQINELHTEQRAVKEAERQGFEAATNAARLRTEASTRLTEARPGHSVDDATSYTVPPGLASRIEELQTARTRLDTEICGTTEQVRKHEKAVIRAQHKLEQSITGSDGKELKALIKAIPTNLIDRITGNRARIAAHETKIEQIRQRHELPADAGFLPFPASEYVRDHCFR